MGALERALDSPSTTTAEKAALGPAGHRRNGSRDGADGDLAVLTAAAEQLFASSATFEEPALLSLLDAVREVSAREHAAMGGGGGKAPVSPGARLFMLERMVDVLLANGRRAHVLWPTVEAHFFNVVASETSGELCRVACAELGRAVSELVGAGFSPESDADAVERLGVETYEIAVLTPLPRLMAGAVAPEARLGALNVLLSILRERGEKITSGWRVVLSTLAAAANARPRGGSGVVGMVGGVRGGVRSPPARSGRCVDGGDDDGGGVRQAETRSRHVSHRRRRVVERERFFRSARGGDALTAGGRVHGGDDHRAALLRASRRERGPATGGSKQRRAHAGQHADVARR